VTYIILTASVSSSYKHVFFFNFYGYIMFNYFQYFDKSFPTIKEQKTFERNLFNKTHRANGKL